MSELKSLAAKMAAIMGEVATMTRDGVNSAQKYNFTTAEAVKAALRPLLKKHSVALFANMLDVTRETSVNKNGTTVVTVIAKMCFTLVCGETGEKMECIWFGEANDYADKACNKAATAATKYFLTNTFLLSTTEPEADEETIAAPAFTEPPSARPTKEQFDLIKTLSRETWGDEWEEKGREFVMFGFNKPLKEFYREDAAELIEALRHNLTKEEQPT